VDFGSIPCRVYFTKSGGKLEMTKTKEILRRIQLKRQLIEITKRDIAELEKELEVSDEKRASL
jgi:hypothetical protein